MLVPTFEKSLLLRTQSARVEDEKSEPRETGRNVTLEEGRVTTEQPCRQDGGRKTKRWQEDAVEEDLAPNDPKSRRMPRSSARQGRNEEADDYGEAIAKTRRGVQ